MMTLKQLLNLTPTASKFKLVDEGGYVLSRFNNYDEVDEYGDSIKPFKSMQVTNIVAWDVDTFMVTVKKRSEI